MEEMRLQKAIAQAGVASRRKAELLIQEGKVKVNGVVVTTLGTTVTDKDSIEVEGKLLKKEHYVYYLFNKPLGLLSTVKDDRGRKTVMDFFKDVDERIFPVGRLDCYTSGLLVMTNDGELANLMTHPSSHLDKTYLVRISRELTSQEINKLENGIMLEDGLTAPAKVKINEDKSVMITIHEGRNRQVRRMFEALDIKVVSLTRTSISFLRINNVRRGQYIEISKEDIEKIRTECIKKKENNKYIKRK